MRIVKAFKAAMMVAAILCMGMLTSCSTPKNVTYFQDLSDGTRTDIAAALDIRVRPDDRLSIVVVSKDPQLASLFNLPIIGQRVGATGEAAKSLSSSSQIASYVVDRYGDIQFPVLGTIHIGGMRRAEVAEYIQKELMSRNLIKDPTVVVDFLNHGVTVLGEVASPGRVTFDRDRYTILDALGEAGDLTINGERETVLVVRQEEGREVAYRVDLTNAESLMQSPVYYLQQEDVIYVSPNDVRKRMTTANGNTPLTATFWITCASFLSSLATTVVVIVNK